MIRPVPGVHPDAGAAREAREPFSSRGPSRIAASSPLHERIRTVVKEDHEEIARAVAHRIAAVIRDKAEAGERCVLGLVFLYVQYREYHEKLKHFRPWSHSYGAIFFTITGFHGMHVLFGVLVLAWALVRATVNGGHWDEHEHTGVACVSLYWHTVDAVWLFIVASLYVSPHLY